MAKRRGVNEPLDRVPRVNRPCAGEAAYPLKREGVPTRVGTPCIRLWVASRFSLSFRLAVHVLGKPLHHDGGHIKLVGLDSCDQATGSKCRGGAHPGGRKGA